LRKPPGEFDATTVIGAYDTHGKQFDEERDLWIKRIIKDSPKLTSGQRSHLERTNRSLNLATRFTYSFPEGDQFWGMPYEGQITSLTESVVRLKPLLDFFIEDAKK